MPIPLSRRRAALALAATATTAVPAARPRPALAQSGPAWRAQVPEVRHVLISAENERDAIARTQGLQAYMTGRLGAPFRVFRATDYAGAVEALRAGHAEFSSLGPAAYALARRVMGERLAPLFRVVDQDGMDGYHSVVVVKSEAPYQGVADLRGRSLAWADPNSASGFQFPSYYLKREGFDPARHFSRTGFSGNHENSVIAVANGTYDAAATFRSNERRGNVARMVEKGMIPAGAVREVWVSPLIPNSPIVGRTDLPAGLSEAFTAALAAMPAADPEAFRQMSTGARGLKEARHEDYLDVVAVVDENSADRRQQRRAS